MYRIVPERSQVWIDGRSSLHPIKSTTTGLEGWLDVEMRDGRLDLRSSPTGHVEFPVDLLRSGNPLEDRELRRRIDARHFPTIDGDVTGMRSTDGDGRFVVTGDISFRGVSIAFEHEMTFAHPDDSTIVAEGEASFDIRDFGMEPPKILMLKVDPEVTVRVKIVADKEP